MKKQTSLSRHPPANSVYDGLAHWYNELVGETGGPYFQHIVGPCLFRRLGSVYGLRVLDLACGQGFLARELARRGARVTGIDAAGEMIRLARTYESGEPLGVTYLHADAASLDDLAASSFDIVVCNLAFMDIADLDGALAEVSRLLVPGGRFLFTILHPCFHPPGARFVTDSTGRVFHRAVSRYFQEVRWWSDSLDGLRSRIGALHRTLSTYLNALAEHDLALLHVEEPLPTPEGMEQYPELRPWADLPLALVVESVRIAPTALRPLLRGALHHDRRRSAILGRAMRFQVYTPPGYEKDDASYPVLYLLHRWGADERQWTDRLHVHEVADRLISCGELPPFLIVMPQGHKSFFLNAAAPHGDYSALQESEPELLDGALAGCGNYEDYFLEEVIPHVEAAYRVLTDRKHRAIGGVSMGGHGALTLALRHPDLFGAAGAHSPTLFDESFYPPWLFGDAAGFAERDPAHLAANLSPHSPSLIGEGKRERLIAPLRLYLDCGCDDELVPRIEALHHTFLAHGLAHEYHLQPGDHSPNYWQRHIEEYLRFYTAEWH